MRGPRTCRDDAGHVGGGELFGLPTVLGDVEFKTAEDWTATPGAEPQGR